jgi:hypothetical protein
MVLWLIAGVLVTEPVLAQEETSEHLWGNLILAYPIGYRHYLEVDFQGQVLTSDGPHHQAILVTPQGQYYPYTWLDLTGELLLSYIEQNEDLKSYVVTPRLGFRIQLIGNRREMFLTDRVAFSNLLRMEYRNFFYSDNREDKHEWRLRNRLELKLAINKPELRNDKTLYLTADGEVFVPLNERVQERFASKFRARVGLGYRISYGWRVELLYIYDSARNTLEEDFREALNGLNLRLKLFF